MVFPRRLAQLARHVCPSDPRSATPTPAPASAGRQREEIGLGAGGADAGSLYDPDECVEEHLMVPMRDGVRLSVHIWTPPGAGAFPGLLQQIYGDPSGSGSSMRRLASHGYVVALQNFRGCQHHPAG